METEVKSIMVNGIEYVQKKDQVDMEQSSDGLKYVIVRSYG